jgi:hypothetical protein
MIYIRFLPEFIGIAVAFYLSLHMNECEIFPVKYCDPEFLN